MMIKKYLAAAAAAVFLSGCSLNRVSLEERPQTGVDDDGNLLVIYEAADLTSEYLILGDHVVAEDESFYLEDHRSYVGRLFKPTTEGECSLIFRIKEQYTDEILETQVFDISVNEQLELTYSSYMTQLLPIHDWLSVSDTVTVIRDGSYSMYGQESSELIVDETSLLFGRWEYCDAADADTDGMSCVSVDYIGSQGVRYDYSFWFGDGDTAYTCRTNDNGLEEWEVYTLDPISSFDYLNLILDGLEGIETDMEGFDGYEDFEGYEEMN